MRTGWDGRMEWVNAVKDARATLGLPGNSMPKKGTPLYAEAKKNLAAST